MTTGFNFYLMVLRKRTYVGDLLDSLVLVYEKGDKEFRDVLDWTEKEETKLLLVRIYNESLKPGERLLSIDPCSPEGFFLSSVVFCQYLMLSEALKNRLDQGLTDENNLRILSPWTIKDVEVERVFQKLTDSLMQRSRLRYCKNWEEPDIRRPLGCFT